MGKRADTFLAHFNRIEKWMRERLTILSIWDSVK